MSQSTDKIGAPIDEKPGTGTVDGKPPAADPPAPGAVVEPQHQDTGTGEQTSGSDWTHEGVNQIADFFSQTPGVASGTIDHARGWFERTYVQGERPPENQKIAHGYGDLSGFGFSDADLPYVHALGNELAAKGVSESEFWGLLRKYTDELRPRLNEHQKAQRRESASAAPDLADIDRNQARDTKRELQTRWGSEYRSNMATIRALLDGLPEAERRALETETIDGQPGSQLAINTPAGAERLLVRARMDGVTAPSRTVTPAAQSSTYTSPGSADAIAAEIRKIEDVRRRDRRAYDRDETMQARVRSLYAAWQTKTGKEWGR